MDTEHKLMLTSLGSDIWVGEWEVLIIVCKIGYKDVLYNTGEYSHYFVITVNGV